MVIMHLSWDTNSRYAAISKFAAVWESGKAVSEANRKYNSATFSLFLILVEVLQHGSDFRVI